MIPLAWLHECKSHTFLLDGVESRIISQASDCCQLSPTHVSEQLTEGNRAMFVASKDCLELVEAVFGLVC